MGFESKKALVMDQDSPHFERGRRSWSDPHPRELLEASKMVEMDNDRHCPLDMDLCRGNGDRIQCNDGDYYRQGDW